MKTKIVSGYRLILVGLCIVWSTAQAGTFNVNSTTSGCTLSLAIQSANTNVNHANCTETGPSGPPHIIEINADLEYSEDVPEQPGNIAAWVKSEITINGNGHSITRSASATETFRFLGVFDQGSIDGHLTLNNITLSGGRLVGFNGGAIYVGEAAELELNQVTLSNNSVGGSFPNGSGGAIFLDTSSKANITNSTLSGNGARSGGGIYASTEGLVTITNSILSGNNASTGGGIFARTESDVTIINSTLSGNGAGDGGGIYVTVTGEVTITNSTLSGNSAENGGGIYSDGVATITNSTLSDNDALTGGGILHTGVVTIINSSLVDNSAEFAGGIYIATDSTTTITNSIISGNLALSSGSEVYKPTISTVTTESSLLGHQELTNAQAFFGFSPNASDINATIDGDGVSQHQPTLLNSILLPLADNGCSQQAGTSATAACVNTHALVEASPAIDKGNQNFCQSNGITNDQRGEPRNDGHCDIGSYEFIADEICFPIKAKSGNVVIFCL